MNNIPRYLRLAINCPSFQTNSYCQALISHVYKLILEYLQCCSSQTLIFRTGTPYRTSQMCKRRTIARPTFRYLLKSRVGLLFYFKGQLFSQNQRFASMPPYTESCVLYTYSGDSGPGGEFRIKYIVSLLQNFTEHSKDTRRFSTQFQINLKPIT
jgi:hypothetical protein